MTKPTPRHGLAGRLLRLPHVVPRHGRAAARHRRARRPRLQPARGRQGVPRRPSTSASSRAPSSSEEDLHKIQLVRERTKTLISFGDCAVTANVPGMRNPIGAQAAPGARLPRERRPQPAHPARGRPGAAADGAAGPPGRQGRRLPARLPAVGRPHLLDPRRPARRARHPTRPRRTVRALTDTDDEPDRHRPGHPHRGPRQDHDPPRRDGEVTDAQFHVTQFRGFERIVQGRPVHEMPSLMARICGICPVSHLVASAKACDEILAVEPPPTGANLRRVMNLAQIVQSNALSFFHLSSPDLLFGFDAEPARRNIFGVAAAAPQLARDGIGVRQFGQQIIEWLGGKRIHPAWVVPGGVDAPLSAETRDRILAGHARRQSPRSSGRWPGTRPSWSSTRTRPPRSDRLPLRLHGARRPGRQRRPLRRPAARDGRRRAAPRRPDRPARLPRVHRRGRRTVVVPEVDLLEDARLPGWGLPRWAAGAPERVRHAGHAPGRRRAARVPAPPGPDPRAARSTTTTPG